MMRIVRDPLPDLRAAGLADRVAAAIEMAMAKEPDERFGSAAAFGNALQQIREAHGPAGHPHAGRAARRSRRVRPWSRPAPRRLGGADAGHRRRAGGGWGHGPRGAAGRSCPAAAAPRPARSPPRSLRCVLAAVVGFLLARQDDDDPTPPTTTESTTTTGAAPVTAALPGEAASTHSAGHRGR